MIIVDLGVFNREAHVISVKEASIWTAVWVSIALLFSFAVHGLTPSEAVVNYLTGYLIELSLSVDNIFVIAVIFSTFKIPMKYQHRVLFWGIVGAVVFRALMILFGIVLINQFGWMIYVFGLFLLFTAYKMYTAKEEAAFNPRESFVFRQIRKVIPITQQMDGERFFIRLKHIRAATPLFVALIVIEVTDVLFALDSIPAILAITNDPFLVFSSNILAILGLRSMYFFLSNMLDRFSYLEYSLIAILSFVGIKMMLTHIWHIPQWFSLLFILLALVSGVVGSLMKTKKTAV
ncbi:UNVERIFIED_CONTAM: hypothetical protein GTU68_039341 [Idotea baltica]|nr:hypothetical protein [Idotea baltica]